MKKTIIMLLIIVILFLTGCSKNEQVVIYTSMEEERNQALIQQLKEKFPNIDVVVQQMATGNVAAKVKNEGTSIEADIILGLETAHMVSVQDNLANLSEFDRSMYLDGVNTSDKYVIWDKYSMSLIIDKDYFKKHKLDIPKTYEDLLDKKYRNLIAMPDPKTSGTGYGFYLNVVNEMGEEKALEYFNNLKKNLREFTTSGSGPSNLLKQGEIAIALGMISQGVAAINEGYNFEIVELKTGSPYNTTSTAIISGRETKDNVKEVFQWLLDEFCKYDKENFLPEKILKEQNTKIKNYPADLKSANMEGINSVETKDKLIESWSSVNG